MSASESSNSLHDPKYVRNLCIMAHVDHGKTTLADAFVASNNILGKSQVGTARYMDSREDEVKRGITMKSSCVTLFYKKKETYTINLIDSPGHVDFSSEVSTAVRLCDGTIIVVDVLEGVCAQTKAVLSQAYLEGIKPCLVLNKIDRLVLERKMNPGDAYCHISQVLEQVNAYMGELYNMDIFRRIEDSEKDESLNSETIALNRWQPTTMDDSNLYFSPEQGNVAFASAYDNWGFRLSDFVEQTVKKTGLPSDEVRKALWGDYYFTAKKGVSKIQFGARSERKDPAFVQIILRNIFQIYDSIIIRKDSFATNELAEKLSIHLPSHIAKSIDHRQKLRHIMSQWKPLANNLYEMILEHVPSPMEISKERATKLMCSAVSQFKELPSPTQSLRPHFTSCSKSDDVPLIVFVSKMFSIERKWIKRRKGPTSIEADDENEEDRILLGFARVFSGTLKPGQTVYVLGPKHHPADVVGIADEHGKIREDRLIDEKLQHIGTAKITHLYLQGGRDFHEIRAAPAGYMVAIDGLESSVTKSATLSSTVFCPTFAELSRQSKPIFRVAVEVENIDEFSDFRAGLDKLYKSDPCVEVEINKGEYILVTAGEVHLQRCIADLEHYCGAKVGYSEPIVSFRETVVPKSTMDKLNETKKDKNFSAKDDELKGEAELENSIFSMKVRAVPLPQDVIDILSKFEKELEWLPKKLDRRQANHNLTTAQISILDHLKKSLSKAFMKNKLDDLVDQIWSFGPKYHGANILINNIKNYPRPSVWDRDHFQFDEENPCFIQDNQVILGFQEACQKGPLCHEPLMGVAFVIDEWKFNEQNEESFEPQLGMMGTIQNLFIEAFKNSHQRLMVAMYTCTIAATDSVMGKMYGLVSKRYGTIQQGDVVEGSTMWEVTTHLPVIESMNFGQELMKTTSGEALPQLTFSHWQLLDIDPFWEPETEEELTHFGEKSDTINRAKVYMNSVRKRKGLSTGEKIVEFAEKQRTLHKKK